MASAASSEAAELDRAVEAVAVVLTSAWVQLATIPVHFPVARLERFCAAGQDEKASTVGHCCLVGQQGVPHQVFLAD